MSGTSRSSTSRESITEQEDASQHRELESDTDHLMRSVKDGLYCLSVLLFLTLWHVVFLICMLFEIMKPRKDNSKENRITLSKKYSSESNLDRIEKENFENVPKTRSSPALTATNFDMTATNESHLQTKESEYSIKYKPLCTSSSSHDLIFENFESMLEPLIPLSPSSSKTRSTRIPINNIRIVMNPFVIRSVEKDPDIWNPKTSTETKFLPESKSPLQAKKELQPETKDDTISEKLIGISNTQDLLAEMSDVYIMVAEFKAQQACQNTITDISPPFDNTHQSVKPMRRIRKWFAQKTGVKHFFSRATFKKY